MNKYTTIQITKEFKTILKSEKSYDESFEAYIKRMRNFYLEQNENRLIHRETK